MEEEAIESQGLEKSALRALRLAEGVTESHLMVHILLFVERSAKRTAMPSMMPIVMREALLTALVSRARMAI